MKMGDRSQEVLAVAVTFLLLTWITVPLRIYVRTFTKSFGLDDGLLIVTQVCSTPPLFPAMILDLQAGMEYSSNYELLSPFLTLSVGHVHDIPRITIDSVETWDRPS